MLIRKVTNQDFNKINSINFSQIQHKIGCANFKIGPVVNEIDILNLESKRQLLNITTNHIEAFFFNFWKSKIKKSFLKENLEYFFIPLVKKISEEFLIKKYGYNVNINYSLFNKSLKEKGILDELIITFYLPILLCDEDNTLMLDLDKTESKTKLIELFIINLIIQVSNCVIYQLINNPDFTLKLEKNFYYDKLLSSRKFELFKNNLKWKLFIYNKLKKPINIYANRYAIYTFNLEGIKMYMLNIVRTNELQKLDNSQLLSISLVELKDFLGSQFETIFFQVKQNVQDLFKRSLKQLIFQIKNK